MDESLDAIWDAPVTPTRPRPDTDGSDDEDQRPNKRPRISLFLPDSDDEAVASPQRPAAAPVAGPTIPDVDAIFADLENDDDLAYQELAPRLDADALRREAEARHAKGPASSQYAVMPSSSPGPPDDNDGKAKAKDRIGMAEDGDEPKKKERKKIARLDEGRLLGPSGFPQLIANTKNFKPKGKGHEASDLNRLLQVYQFWSHRLYPKTQFKDTVERVEKLCHSRRMQSSLSVWRDEAHGTINGKKPEDTIDLTSDAERDIEPQDRNRDPFQSKSRGSSPNAHASSSKASSPIPSRPPSSASELFDGPAEDDDLDIETLIREEETRLAKESTRTTPEKAPPDAFDEDEMMWFEDDDRATLDKTATPPDSTKATEDDDDMWDALREMEGQETAPPPAQRQVEPDEDEWDAMYH